MFKRLILEDYAAVCTLIAFIVVAAVFVANVWKAIRMSRDQADHLANLPLESNPPHHDKRA